MKTKPTIKVNPLIEVRHCWTKQHGVHLIAGFAANWLWIDCRLAMACPEWKGN